MNRTLFVLVLLVSASCRRADAPQKPLSPTAAKGAEVFAKYCVLCHGAHGEGYAADNAPSLVSVTFRETVSAQFLRDAIERGRPGTAMAGYAQVLGGPLGREQVDQLLAFLQLGSPGTELEFAL